VHNLVWGKADEFSQPAQVLYHAVRVLSSFTQRKVKCEPGFCLCSGANLLKTPLFRRAKKGGSHQSLFVSKYFFESLKSVCETTRRKLSEGNAGRKRKNFFVSLKWIPFFTRGNQRAKQGGQRDETGALDFPPRDDGGTARGFGESAGISGGASAVAGVRELLPALRDADAVAAVLPPELLGALLRLAGEKPVLLSQSARIPTGRTRASPEGREEPEFAFVHTGWRRLVRLEIETMPL
jgi:hypothetical protein